MYPLQLACATNARNVPSPSTDSRLAVHNPHVTTCTLYPPFPNSNTRRGAGVPGRRGPRPLAAPARVRLRRGHLHGHGRALGGEDGGALRVGATG